jgi:hypothetical protein
MEITKCPHKNRKHYAKVRSFVKSKLFRICVQAAIVFTAVAKKLLSVLILTACFTLRACARHAISQTITRYDERLLIFEF